MSGTLQESIRSYILENYLFTNDTSALAFDDSLIGRGIVDSTGVLELVLYLEEQFGVRVAEQEMIPENLDTVNRIAEFVRCKREAA